MTLPSNVSFGTVVGQFIDSSGVALAGTVTFSPTASKLLDPGATPPVTILQKAVTVTLVGGGFTQQLVATDDADLNPVGWNYTVSFALTGVKVDTFNINLPTGSTVDLTLVAPVGASNGKVIIQGPGVAAGGAAGQVLVKASAADFDTEWVDAPSGTGGGTPGEPGESAYQIAVDNGFSGSETDWLASLKGADGAPGASAYAVAQAGGFTGTQADWLASLKGAQGDAGDSAYQVAVAGGFSGTQAAWLASLEGPQGDAGPAGSGTSVSVSTGTEARPAGAPFVVWIAAVGYTGAAPSNMAVGDLWFAQAS